jgi:uncharacterized UBP type Zn finger protein
MEGLCAHLAATPAAVTPSGEGCDECIAIGSEWVHLRLCLECGNVACCDSSPNRHASRHARAKRHPVIRSFEPGEAWRYCFPDESWSED